MLHQSCIGRLEDCLLSEENRLILNPILNLIALELSEDDELRMIDIINGQPSIARIDLRFKDYRIKKMVYENFRTYPGNDYSVDFCKCDQETPCSLFLMGNNGTGKSTMYCALETLYLGYSTYAKKMCPGATDKYLTYAFRTRHDANDTGWGLNAEISDPNDAFMHVSQENKHPLGVASFFCSDYDVQELYDSGVSLYEWILKQMGYEELLKKHRKVDALYLQYKDRQSGLGRLTKEEYNAILKELLSIKSIKDILDEANEMQSEKAIREQLHKEKLSAKLFREYWMKLMADSQSVPDNMDPLLQITQNVNTVKEDIISKLQKLYKKIYDVIPKEDTSEKTLVTVIEKWIRDNSKFDNNRAETSEEISNNIQILENMQSFLDIFERTVVYDFVKTFRQGIENILEDFSDHNEKFQFENCELENIKSLCLKVKYTFGDESFTASPQEYLNAFRFKLFCLTLKLTVSFFWMKTHKTSCPVVIDDIFNASDFENSIKLEYYAHFIKEMYRNNVLSNEFQIPLQFILLTHDDIVFNSFKSSYEAPLLDEFGKNELYKDKFCLLSGRLMPVEELKTENVNNVYFKY